MSRPSNPAVWRMDEYQRRSVVGRHVGRWADVIVNLGRESSTDRDQTWTGEVIGWGRTNFGTVSGTIVVRLLDGSLMVLSLATVRRIADRGDARDLIQPAADPAAGSAVDAGLVPIPFPASAE